ncbi:hypothetical protein V8C86DRAFT_2713688 [Haematococcus lacustris]
MPGLYGSQFPPRTTPSSLASRAGEQLTCASLGQRQRSRREAVSRRAHGAVKDTVKRRPRKGGGGGSALVQLPATPNPVSGKTRQWLAEVKRCGARLEEAAILQALALQEVQQQVMDDVAAANAQDSASTPTPPLVASLAAFADQSSALGCSLEAVLLLQQLLDPAADPQELNRVLFHTRSLEQELAGDTVVHSALSACLAAVAGGAEAEAPAPAAAPTPTHTTAKPCRCRGGEAKQGRLDGCSFWHRVGHARGITLQRVTAPSLSYCPGRTSWSACGS